jgi:hypothetical protein
MLMATQDTTKLYLDYLEKEMTITGILSTFCVAVVGLALQKVVSANPEETPYLNDIWKQGWLSLILASLWMLLAALFFYRQRSRLGWVYGQISLSVSVTPQRTNEWLNEADSWPTWLHYHTGFAFMMLAFCYYGLAIWCASSKNVSLWISVHYFLSTILPLLVVITTLAARAMVFHRYPNVDHPFKKFFLSLFRA